MTLFADDIYEVKKLKLCKQFKISKCVSHRTIVSMMSVVSWGQIS